VKKTTIKSILVYSPASETHALRDAKSLAKATGARLKVVDVLEPLPAYVEVWIPKSSGMFDAQREATQERLHRKVSKLKSEGVKAEGAILEGHPEAAILQEVREGDHDMLMVGAARKPDGHLATRSMRLLRKCPCPVWIEGARALRGKMRVLAALDTIPGDAHRADLNLKIASLAGALARACDAEMHVVNAWEAYGESLLRSRLGAKPTDITRYVQEIHLHHREELNAVLKRARIHLPESQIHLIKGEAAEALPKLCNKLKASMLVLGTVARSGLSAALIGNTAESVVASLTCSMLAVKPTELEEPEP
jgi:nucleotide-binding universal stress UspA family protein